MNNNDHLHWHTNWVNGLWETNKLCLGLWNGLPNCGFISYAFRSWSGFNNFLPFNSYLTATLAAILGITRAEHKLLLFLPLCLYTYTTAYTQGHCCSKSSQNGIIRNLLILVWALYVKTWLTGKTTEIELKQTHLCLVAGWPDQLPV